MTDGSKKKRSPREVFESLENSARELEVFERIERMSEAELDREIRAQGGDPDAIAGRAEALVDRLAAGGESVAPTRLAAGVPRRQAMLAILAEAAEDPRKKALLEEELGGKAVEGATDEELARAVARVRGLRA